ncbi:ATPase [bacterium]|jgi:Ca2+-transporting ATPase|nr:ATPase [bacterium]MDP6571452.1 HAD-IC family P-type ATPase [Patescibacteria group bacterium]MDP6756194.1 HAD-IC family P-type ATPase [Patescibacteria group bacterium]|tara:strand:- start:9254 stop:12022 length:2769 start_codon:yes stop_codon:yes gene_type:complete
MPERKTKKIQDVKAANKATRYNGWYNLALAEAAKKLGINKHGLSQKQVHDRLQKHGHNVLPEEPLTSSLVLFLRQFQSSLTYILLIAAVISAAIGEHIDAYVILAAVVINVVVGFFQEYKAQKALASLKKIITQKVWVIREEQEREIESKELVPGDIVVLNEGDKVTADGRLFLAEHLKVNEAALTGESEPVEKINRALEGRLVLADQHNMVFTGTIVTQGHGRFFVTSTGLDTEIGKIASLVKETKEVRTPLQKKLDSFSKKLGLFILALSAALVVVGLLYNYGFAEIFVTAVAVAVAAIPEGLIVGVTVILAIGMQRILRKKSLVRKLVAAETLGSTNVICVDKTGTVTLGEMRVVQIVTAHQSDSYLKKDSNGKTSQDDREKAEQEIKKLNHIAVYCNNAVIASAEEHKSTEKEELRNQVVVGSPTEKALLLSAVDGDFKEAQLHESRPRLDEVPFSSKKKFMATLNAWTKNQHSVYLKGAPEKILAMCEHYQAGHSARKLDTKKRKEFLKLYEKLSSQGLRLLAGAYKGAPASFTSFDELHDYNEDAIFVGFWGIKDPIRPEAEETIKKTRKAGVRTIIITGDNSHTAIAIAKELGVNPKPDEVIDGTELASISALELGKAVARVKLFSRTTPEDKLRIVAALQSHGDVVAMTGDGVNDAPALAKADIGVALGSGTDVAKETADMIVLDNNFSTIVAAVRQGRVIFDNIRKVILYLLANGFTEMSVIVVGILLGWPLPLLAVQILWINLVTDGLPDLALTQEPEEPEIMTEKPQKRNAPILDFERKFLILFISAITTIFTLGVFYLIWKTTGDLDKARTIAFTTVGVESLLYVFSVRSIRHSIFETNILRNKWLIAAVVGGFAIQIIGVYAPFFQKILHTVPLSLVEWFIIVSVCLWVIGLIEVVKHFFIAQRKSVHA